MAGIGVHESHRRGRGVFATRRFQDGNLIEVCPIIVLSEIDARKIDSTRLYSYYFGWGPHGNQAAIALGYGSLYNHAATPNAVYQKDADTETISFIATRTIQAGEEIFITYNTGPDSTGASLWFEVE